MGYYIGLFILQRRVFFDLWFCGFVGQLKILALSQIVSDFWDPEQEREAPSQNLYLAELVPKIKCSTICT